MDESRLADSLLKWISSFGGVEGHHGTLEDLADGVACSEILNQLVPARFSKSDVNGLHQNVQSNIEKLENIQKVIKSIATFYDVDFQTPPSILPMPNAEQVASGNASEMLKLLELLLGVAVQCQDRERRVKDLMGLDAAIKQNLMGSIKNLMHRIEEGKKRIAAQAESMNIEDIRQLLAEKNELQRLYDGLKGDHEVLTQRFDETSQKLEETKASSSLDSSKSQSQPAESSNMQQLLHSMRAEMEEYQHTLAHERSENANTVKDLNKTITELRRSVATLEQEVGSMDRLRDEAEELRESAARADNLENKLESYRDKLEELTEMRQEMKELQTQNSSLNQQVASLEELGRKSISLQQTVAKYKEQISELEAGKLEEEKRGDGLLSETKQLREAIEDLEKDNKRLHAERRELNQRIQEIEETSPSPSGGLSLGEALANNTTGTAELNEKIARLEGENAMLRARSEGDSEFQTLLDDVSAQKAKLAQENRAMNMQVLDLKAENEKLKKKTAKGTDDLAIEQLAISERALKQAKAKITELETELRDTQEELLRMKKETSMMGLDQKEMLAEAERKAQESAQTLISSLEGKVENLSKELQTTTEDRKAATSKLDDIESKYEKVMQQRDEKMEELNAALRQNNELSSRLHQIETQGSEGLRLQMSEIEARLKSGSSTSNSEEALQLQLKLAQLEKEHMVALAKAEKDKMDSLAELKEKHVSNETRMADLKEKLKASEDLINEQKAKIVSQKDQLSSKAGAEMNVAISTLQNQLEEKKKDWELERQKNLTLKAQYDREQQLMVSAWYDLVQQNQRLLSRTQATNASGSSGSMSFLQKQRQASLSTPRK
eukprot:m.106917 g.106917  ORF g.106917 m.106917 type:complete len:841 (+) comp13904_c0_seq1:70-2592(+)